MSDEKVQYTICSYKHNGMSSYQTSQKSYYHTKSFSTNKVLRVKQSECEWNNQHLQSQRIRKTKKGNINKLEEVQSKYYSYLESASSLA